MMKPIELVAVIPEIEYLDKTLKAIEVSLKSFDKFSNVVIICPLDVFVRRPKTTLDLQFRITEFTYQNYSAFMIKELYRYVWEDYCITIQWDSAIIDGSKWTDRFLDYDYIGAPWPNQWCNRVGNGGFSLRSKEFLQCSSELDYVKLGVYKEHDAEDYFTCVTNYEKMLRKGINFAPIPIASQFCVEHPIPEIPHNYNKLSSYHSFAFHGAFNIAGLNYINGVY